MCFSASASFSASIGLLIIGLATLRNVTSTRKFLVATIPFMFSIQQAAEGVVWLGIAHAYAPLIITIAKYIFLTFALLVWPFWIPLVMMIIEKNMIRRKMLYVLTVIGLLISLYLIHHLLHFGASANIMCSHIVYYSDIPLNTAYVIGAFYFIAVIGAFLLSSISGMWVMGLTVGIAYAISYYMYYQAFTSVWCFFSAILSAFVYKIVKDM